MLESLAIKNFRCLQHFEIDKLGRVNLIVGKNNAGKSTVLEALRIYASHASKTTLDAIAQAHDEIYQIPNDLPLGPHDRLPFQDLFHGRAFPTEASDAITIGSKTKSEHRLHIKHVRIVDLLETSGRQLIGEDIAGKHTSRFYQLDKTDSRTAPDIIKHALKSTSGANAESWIILNQTPGKRIHSLLNEYVFQTPCSHVPTHVGSMSELAALWDKIALTDLEDMVMNALRIITPEFERLVFVNNPTTTDNKADQLSRMARIKLKGSSDLVSLRSMGEGMVRVLQLVLQGVSARGGFLLIDEFENGLHYSVQEKVWTLLFEMAAQLDIQIFATTHSWDCIDSFSKVALAKQDIDGVLFRVGRSVRTSDRGRVIATVFDEEALYSITQSDVEVR